MNNVITNNLGNVKLIAEQDTPPSNPSLVWWDTSLSSPIHKVFNTALQEWRPLGTDAQLVTLGQRSETQGGNVNLDISGINSYRLILNDDITSFNVTGTPILNEPIYFTIVADQDGRAFTFGNQFSSTDTYDTGAIVQLYFDEHPRTPVTDSTVRNTALYKANADGVTGAFDATQWDLFIILDTGIPPIILSNSNHDTNYVLRRVIDQDNSDSQHWVMRFDPDNIT